MRLLPERRFDLPHPASVRPFVLSCRQAVPVPVPGPLWHWVCLAALLFAFYKLKFWLAPTCLACKQSLLCSPRWRQLTLSFRALVWWPWPAGRQAAWARQSFLGKKTTSMTLSYRFCCLVPSLQLITSVKPLIQNTTVACCITIYQEKVLLSEP